MFSKQPWQKVGEVVQINDHEGVLARWDPGVEAGIKKKSDFIEKKLIDDMLGSEGFVIVKPEEIKEEYEIVEEVQVIEECMEREYDWRKEMKIELTKDDDTWKPVQGLSTDEVNEWLTVQKLERLDSSSDDDIEE